MTVKTGPAKTRPAGPLAMAMASMDYISTKLDTHAFYPATQLLQNCKLLLIEEEICTVEHHVIALMNVSTWCTWLAV